MSNPYDKAVSTGSSVLGPTLKFKGELTASENLLIQGQIEGSINHTSSLTVGQEGRVKADVKAEHISIEGKVDGDLSGSKSVVVREGANVNGNIFSPIVTLLEGSTFNGKIDMSGKDQSQAVSPEKVITVSADQSIPDAAGKSSAGYDTQTSDKKRSANAA